MTQPQGSSGRVLAGRYRLDSVLGSGGMGTVWRAEDEMLGRIVAVKELRMHGSVDEDEKHRLIVRTLREAKATARIRHAAAVTVYDVVEEDDRPWIVMELVDGRSLAEVVKQDGPVTPVRAAEIALELLGVLGAAHSHGILHRDVKPSNVLIGEDGRVVLTDFGIASVEGDTSVTSTGMLVGAPSYISPERARGQKPGPPADLWSLGGTLYAMVEGKPPYDRGSALATLTAVMTEELPAPANAGPLRPVIEGLLDKDPVSRLDASATRSMLRRIIAESTAKAEATTQAALPTADPTSGGIPEPEVGPADVAVKPPAKVKARKSGTGLRTVRIGSRLPAAEPAPAAVPAAAAAVPAAEQALAETGSWSRSRTLGASARGRLRRRHLLAAVLVLVLLLIAGGFWLARGSGGTAGAAGAGNSSGVGGARTAPVTSGGPSAAAPPSASVPGSVPAASAAGSSAAAASPAASSAAATPPAVPAGYRLYTDPSGFSIQLPDWLAPKGKGYRDTSETFEGNGLSLLVDWQSPGNPSALADWQKSEPGNTFPAYQRVRLESVVYRQWTNAADWEWTFASSSGQRKHALNRGFVTGNGKYGYALYWTANDSDWNSAEISQARLTGFESFQPAP